MENAVKNTLHTWLVIVLALRKLVYYQCRLYLFQMPYFSGINRRFRFTICSRHRYNFYSRKLHWMPYTITICRFMEQDRKHPQKELLETFPWEGWNASREPCHASFLIPNTITRTSLLPFRISIGVYEGLIYKLSADSSIRGDWLRGVSWRKSECPFRKWSNVIH